MAAMPGSKAGSIDDLVEGLRARLEREPGDMNGWVLLGRSYHFLQRWPEATAAFDKARALGWKEEMPALDGAAPAASAMPNPVFLGVQDAVQRQSEQLQARP